MVLHREAARTLRSDYHASSGVPRRLLPASATRSVRGRRRHRRRGSPPSATKASTVGPAPETTAGTPRARSVRDQRERLRHRRFALSLVQEVLGGPQQQRRAPTERRDEQRGPAGVGGGVGVRHRVGEQAARDLGAARRTAGRARPPRSRDRPGRARPRPRPPAWPQITNPPSSAGATLSGWPSIRVASASAAASSSRSAPAIDERPGEHDARPRSRPRRSPCPRPCGIRLVAGEREARAAAHPGRRRRPASRGPRGGSRRAGRRRHPPPRRSPRGRRRPTSADQGVGQLQGEAEAVVAGPEVGAGGRDLDGDRSGDERHVRPARPRRRRPRRRRRRPCRRGR